MISWLRDQRDKICLLLLHSVSDIGTSIGIVECRWRGSHTETVVWRGEDGRTPIRCCGVCGVRL